MSEYDKPKRRKGYTVRKLMCKTCKVIQSNWEQNHEFIERHKQHSIIQVDKRGMEIKDSDKNDS